jgi:hypothetical protein
MLHRSDQDGPDAIIIRFVGNLSIALMVRHHRETG